MGLQLFSAFLMIFLLHTATTKLMYVNGVQQKDLTPVKPHEVDAFVSGLKLFAQVVRREANGGPDARKSTKIPGRDQNNTSKYEPKVSAAHELTNNSRMLAQLNSSKIGIPTNLTQIRPERGVGSTYDVIDSINYLLVALQRNSSRPAFFITNFASTQSDETD